MTRTTDLQNGIKSAIRPWVKSKERPPFSKEELITMALVAEGGQMRQGEIVGWIARTFTFYRSSRLLGDDLNPTFNRFESPAIKIFDRGLWQVEIDEARVFLEVALGTSRSGTFRFLDLPPELRNKIYDMVFQYPVSGILLDPYETKTFQFATKDLSTPYSSRVWDYVDRWLLSTGTYEQPAQDSLNILLVNKQIFAEAFPRFYGNNVFYFRCIGEASKVLRSIPPYRRQHMSNLAIKCDLGDNADQSGRVCSFLNSMPNLRKLHLNINESRWARRRALMTLPVMDVLKTPLVTRLRKVRVEEVIFTGDCPSIAASLKAEIESEGSKTRKGNEGEVVARVRHERAAKRNRRNDYA